MNRRETTLILVACGILSAAATAHCAFADKPETSLAVVSRAAEAQLHPLPSRSPAAKNELVSALNRLDARLGEDKESGAGWKSFCQVEKLQQQLQLSTGPDLAVLNQILHEKYLNGNVGLELVWFADVRRALRKYLDTASAVGNPKWKADYEKILDQLAEDLQASAQGRTADGAFRINEAIGRLSDARQAPELLSALRSQLSHANVFVRVKSEVVGRASAARSTKSPHRRLHSRAQPFTARGGPWGNPPSPWSPPANSACWTSIFRRRTPARTSATTDRCAFRPPA